MKKYSVNVNGTAYEVEIELISESEVGKGAPKSGTYTITAAGAKTAAPAPAPKAAPAPAAPAAPATPSPAGSTNIESPMPGNIWQVPVAEGEKVKAGQALIILEAMKMENEIVSPVDGTVTKIAVKKGDAVAAQQLLCVIS